MTTTTDLAPDVLTTERVDAAICDFIILARGLGAMLAREPDDAGWDQSTFFDFDASDILYDGALAAAKDFAKHNQLFYNTAKLERYLKEKLVAAYGDEFMATVAMDASPAA